MIGDFKVMLYYHMPVQRGWVFGSVVAVIAGIWFGVAVPHYMELQAVLVDGCVITECTF